MRRAIALLVLVTLVVTTAFAVTRSDEPASPRLDDVEVAGAAGEPPTVTFDQPFTAQQTARRVLAEGEGEELPDGATVTVHYLGVNATDGTEFDSSYGTAPLTVTLDEQRTLPGFVKGLVGVPVGSRVLVAMAPDDAFGPQGGLEAAGIAADDTLLFVVDVEEVRHPLERATGAPVEPVAGLPAVHLDEAGVPTVIVPDAPPPAELVAQPLVRGEGAAVVPGQTVTVHYTGIVWGGDAPFDSSWERGQPAEVVLGVGGVIAGWDEGLVGQTVGSQVLLVVPPEAGYGAEGNAAAGIAGTDTLVFVVDILDAY